MSLQSMRIAAVCGIIFTILAAIGGVVLAPIPPMESSAPGVIAAYYANHRTGLLVQGYVFGIAWIGFLVFLAGLRDVLDRARIWATLALAGGVTWLALNFVSQATISGLTDRVAGHFATGSTIVAMHDQIVMYFSYSFFALAACLIGAATGGQVAGVLSRWLCWAGYAVAAVAIVTTLGIIWTDNSVLFTLASVDFVLFVLWVLAASISMLRMRTVHDEVVGLKRQEVGAGMGI